MNSSTWFVKCNVAIYLVAPRDAGVVDKDTARLELTAERQRVSDENAALRGRLAELEGDAK